MNQSKEKTENTSLNNILDSEKLKFCFECGICTASCPMAEFIPEYYNPRILLQNLSESKEEILKSPQLWLCAWCYRCYRRCPQNLNIPEIFLKAKKFAVEKGYLEGFYEALTILEEKIPLLISACNVCFHPERAIKNEKILKNTFQKIFSEKVNQKMKKNNDSPLQGRVAIIGSGPAGLSAAKDLAKIGYNVTVFEASQSLGGMLRRCIPKYRLPRISIDSDIKRVKEYGIKFKPNMIIGNNIEFNDLIKDFDAVFIATGCHNERILKIQGNELQGVVYALDFLEKSNSNKVKVNGKVVVIGGGNVAIDSALTALKLGAKNVTILYRRTQNEMPASPWEINEAKEEGIKIEFLVGPKKIIGKNGKVTGIECIRMELGDYDETGRRHPSPINNSEYVLEAQTIIIAIGQSPNTLFLPRTIELDKDKTINVDLLSLKTSSCGIFAGGDATFGAASIMEAISAGKQAARSIDRYLKKYSKNFGKKINKMRECEELKIQI